MESLSAITLQCRHGFTFLTLVPMLNSSERKMFKLDVNILQVTPAKHLSLFLCLFSFVKLLFSAASYQGQWILTVHTYKH